MEHIATLKVYVDADNSDPLASMGSRMRWKGGTDYEIIMTPNSTIQPDHIEQLNPLDSLAHELGHFVATLFRLKEHQLHYLSEMLQLPHPLSKHELEAWQVAEKINPAMANSPVREMAMARYVAADERHGLL